MPGSTRDWGPRLGLAVIAAACGAVAVALYFHQGATSSTVQKTVAPAAAATSAARAGAAGQPATSTTTVTTTVRTSGSDTLELGVLGFGAVFALAALFYPRLSAITGPGGIGITLTDEQQAQATSAVAQRASHRTAAVAPGQPAGPPPAKEALLAQPALTRLATMATSQPPQWLDSQQLMDLTRDGLGQALRATLWTMRCGQRLMRLAKTSPEGMRALAGECGIPDAEQAQIMAGAIPQQTWERIADRALTEEGLPPAQG